MFWAINNLIYITLPPNPAFTTSTLSKIIGSMRGYDADQNCTIIVWTGFGQKPPNITLIADQA